MGLLCKVEAIGGEIGTLAAAGEGLGHVGLLVKGLVDHSEVVAYVLGLEGKSASQTLRAISIVSYQINAMNKQPSRWRRR